MFIWMILPCNEILIAENVPTLSCFFNLRVESHASAFRFYDFQAACEVSLATTVRLADEPVIAFPLRPALPLLLLLHLNDPQHSKVPPPGINIRILHSPKSRPKPYLMAQPTDQHHRQREALHKEILHLATPIPLLTIIPRQRRNSHPHLGDQDQTITPKPHPAPHHTSLRTKRHLRHRLMPARPRLPQTHMRQTAASPGKHGTQAADGEQPVDDGAVGVRVGEVGGAGRRRRRRGRRRAGGRAGRRRRIRAGAWPCSASAASVREEPNTDELPTEMAATRITPFMTEGRMVAPALSIAATKGLADASAMLVALSRRGSL
ncbi:uncharacterized protein B0H64DRAFT_205968 [Chaetomium fimeti]|uniref:Uncharacterized protein n=1 Tax=Chaetomium fimeti TaxID=1854472 RepID=A0AAE0HAR9_9PEZI|nr:hypothetical protein B0H64DRAFT_205968 [Chaetomium fimeti]